MHTEALRIIAGFASIPASTLHPTPLACHHARVTDNERHARHIVRTLRDHGFVAYFAGGCVRDRLLNLEPKDFDVATNARAEVVQRVFSNTVPVGVQFGVVLVVNDGTPCEVATFRSDGVYFDGRHPASVHFSNAQEDARRRDFTINGMFYDPLTEEVIDYVGGREDLQAGVIRAIGDPYARFAEDRLRMLRAVRLAARLDFTITPDTFAAIHDLAPTIGDIAWERIGDEIIKILTGRGAKRAFELLSESRLLHVVLPEIETMRGVEQSPDFHPEGDVFVHTLLLLDKLDHPTETLALGALLHDVAKPMCQIHNAHRITFHGHCEKGAELAIAICQRLKRSRETWERVGYLVRNHLRLVSAPEMRTATLKRFLREEGIEELLELARLDALSSSGDLRPYQFCRQQLAALAPEQIAPPRLLSGHDLVALGLSPGPRFKEILGAVEDAQLEGQLHTREEALSWVKQQCDI
ncbi:MAG: CCA tRNA nucleotidyltransferase [Deltaproteobacteria bacterium]|nr:CCA tRNA nucleotidyltransferase [Deltaproteobacteria bacterium]